MEGRDLEDHPFAFLKSVEFKAGVAREGGFQSRYIATPFQCLLPDKMRMFVVTLEFQAHHGEPPLDIPVTVAPRTGAWVESTCVATSTA